MLKIKKIFNEEIRIGKFVTHGEYIINKRSQTKLDLSKSEPGQQNQGGGKLPRIA